jgi:hypothetical protein
LPNDDQNCPTRGFCVDDPHICTEEVNPNCPGGEALRVDSGNDAWGCPLRDKCRRATFLECVEHYGGFVYSWQDTGSSGAESPAGRPIFPNAAYWGCCRDYYGVDTCDYENIYYPSASPRPKELDDPAYFIPFAQ